MPGPGSMSMNEGGTKEEEVNLGQFDLHRAFIKTEFFSLFAPTIF